MTVAAGGTLHVGDLWGILVQGIGRIGAVCTCSEPRSRFAQERVAFALAVVAIQLGCVGDGATGQGAPIACDLRCSVTVCSFAR